MMKYANTGFLAANVSLVNEIGNICKQFNIDAYEVAERSGSTTELARGSCAPDSVGAIASPTTSTRLSLLPVTPTTNLTSSMQPST
jgi:UDPglucose 6-dehydrogenase